MQPRTAIAHPNIAFIKYWGNRDSALRIPLNGSISMNLDALETRTTVRFDEFLSADRFILNGQAQAGKPLQRVTTFMDVIRGLAYQQQFASVVSENNFPSGAGIASSASAFAALARRGSGSAARSIPGGFVEWQAGYADEDSFAYSIARPEYWNLVDVIAIVDPLEKATGSSEGHDLAASSPLNPLRQAGELNSQRDNNSGRQCPLA